MITCRTSRLHIGSQYGRIEYPNFSGQFTDSGSKNRNPGAHLLETCSWKGYSNDQYRIISDV